ncbi:MAG: hypothetical protein ACO3D8_05720 [Ilumatobacteraceae bacterium]
MNHEQQADDERGLDHEVRELTEEVFGDSSFGTRQELSGQDRNRDDAETGEDAPIETVMPSRHHCRADDGEYGNRVEAVTEGVGAHREVRDGCCQSHPETAPRTTFERAFCHANTTETTVVNPPVDTRDSLA